LKKMLNMQSREEFILEKKSFQERSASYSAAVTANLGKGAVGFRREDEQKFVLEQIAV
jgi:hypothetical protein